MSLVFALWLALSALVAALWVARLYFVESAMRSRLILRTQSYDRYPAGAPRVSILLAAKDEENNIVECVRSLLEQDYPNFELIVVDDRSTDATPRLLEGLALESPERLRVQHVTSLPDGWYGKHNAMRLGVAAATGDWLLFTDADCRQTSRRTLSLAVSEAVHHNVDFLSVFPNLDRRTVWEHILQPLCAFVLMVWFRPAKVNRRDSAVAYANGAFMLMTRGCYDAIGGHEAVRDRINEDIAMARRAKEKGLALRVVENEGLYVARMYDSPSAAFHGWSRIFYGCLETPGRVAAACALITVSGLFPWVSLLAASVGWLATRGADPWYTALAAWGGVVLLIQLATARLYHALGYGLGWSLTYVVGAFVCATILFNSFLKTIGLTRTTWRRTTYSRSIEVPDQSVQVGS